MHKRRDNYTVTATREWEQWILFMLDAIQATSMDTIARVRGIRDEFRFKLLFPGGSISVQQSFNTEHPVLIPGTTDLAFRRSPVAAQTDTVAVTVSDRELAAGDET